MIHVNTNTIDAMLTLELVEAVDCWSKSNVEIAITSKAIFPCWICSAMISECSTMLTNITHSEIKAAAANILASRYFLSKYCPAPGKTRDDNNAALIALFIK